MFQTTPVLYPEISKPDIDKNDYSTNKRRITIDALSKIILQMHEEDKRIKRRNTATLKFQLDQVFDKTLMDNVAPAIQRDITTVPKTLIPAIQREDVLFIKRDSTAFAKTTHIAKIQNSGLIDPRSLGKLIWDFFVCLVILYYIIIVPLDIVMHIE
eukprot:135459_1